VSAAQPARSVAADLMGRVHDAGRAVGESTKRGRVLHGPDGEVETVVDDQAVRLGRRREGRKHLGRGTRLSGRSSVRASWRDVTRKFRVRHAVLESTTLDEAVLEEVRGMGREQLVHEYRRLCITGFRLTTGRQRTDG